jgi:hypothetical protein
MIKKSLNLNSKDIKIEVLKFLCHFIVLSILSFYSVYFLFESFNNQNNRIKLDVENYKEILNKQQDLKLKIDTIYYQMSLLNTGKVDNDLILGNYISKNIKETKNLIGDDKNNDFKHYSLLLSKIDTILYLKNELTNISDKENLSLRDLKECIGKVTKIKKELSNPTATIRN